MTTEKSPREFTFQVKHGKVIGGSGIYMDTECVEAVEKSAFDALKAECERLLTERRQMKRANKEWTANDQVTFGKLYEEIDALKGECERLRAEQKQLRNWFTARDILSLRGWDDKLTGEMFLALSPIDLVAAEDGKAESAVRNITEELTQAREEIAGLIWERDDALSSLKNYQEMTKTLLEQKEIWLARNQRLVEALKRLKEYADNIRKNHPNECASGCGYSLLGEMALQVSTDTYYALRTNEGGGE